MAFAKNGPSLENYLDLIERQDFDADRQSSPAPICDRDTGIAVITVLQRSRRVKEREALLFETYFSDLLDLVLSRETLKHITILLIINFILWGVSHG
ncbi:MAG: hypothetical protein ACRCWO_09040 [Bosea sp. (in: a-proteobacteria)]